jgi:hypothetical protein
MFHNATMFSTDISEFGTSRVSPKWLHVLRADSVQWWYLIWDVLVSSSWECSAGDSVQLMIPKCDVSSVTNMYAMFWAAALMPISMDILPSAWWVATPHQGMAFNQNVVLIFVGFDDCITEKILCSRFWCGLGVSPSRNAVSAFLRRRYFALLHNFFKSTSCSHRSRL